MVIPITFGRGLVSVKYLPLFSFPKAFKVQTEPKKVKMEFVDAEFTGIRSKVLVIHELTKKLGSVVVREIIKNLMAENQRSFTFLLAMQHWRKIEDMFPFTDKIRASEMVMGPSESPAGVVQMPMLRYIDLPRRKQEGVWLIPCFKIKNGQWRKQLTPVRRKSFRYGSLHPNRVENENTINVLQ